MLAGSMKRLTFLALPRLPQTGADAGEMDLRPVYMDQNQTSRNCRCYFERQYAHVFPGYNLFTNKTVLKI